MIQRAASAEKSMQGKNTKPPQPSAATAAKATLPATKAAE